MSGINQFTIVGNLTKDPVLRHLPSGTATVTYTVAVDDVWYEDGQTRQRTDFIPVTTFGKQAENDCKFLRKGSAVAVTGRIRSWYKAQEERGGYNFEAQVVQYLTRAPASAGQHSSADDQGGQPDAEWTRQYDQASAAQEQMPPQGGKQSKARARA